MRRASAASRDAADEAPRRGEDRQPLAQGARSARTRRRPTRTSAARTRTEMIGCPRTSETPARAARRWSRNRDEAHGQPPRHARGAKAVSRGSGDEGGREGRVARALDAPAHQASLTVAAARGDDRVDAGAREVARMTSRGRRSVASGKAARRIGQPRGRTVCAARYRRRRARAATDRPRPCDRRSAWRRGQPTSDRLSLSSMAPSTPAASRVALSAHPLRPVCTIRPEVEVGRHEHRPTWIHSGSAHLAVARCRVWMQAPGLRAAADRPRPARRHGARAPRGLGDGRRRGGVADLRRAGPRRPSTSSPRSTTLRLRRIAAANALSDVYAMGGGR
jgi:hypothetical protein